MSPAAKKKSASTKKAAPKKKAAAPKAVKAKETAAKKAEVSAVVVPAEAPEKKAAIKNPKIRIRLHAFDHTVLDEAAAKIIDTAERAGAVVHGPIPLPTQIKRFTVLRASFKFKDARDQFEMRTHRRLIDLTETTFKTMDALQNLSLPSGVDIEIKMMQ